MIYPDLQTVRIYAETYTRIPIYSAMDYAKDDLLDLYAALRRPYSFFLESGVLNSYGRYSIIALPAKNVWLAEMIKPTLCSMGKQSSWMETRWIF